MLLHLEAAFQKLPQDSRFEALIVVKLNNIFIIIFLYVYIYICEFKLIFKRYEFNRQQQETIIDD